MTVPAANGENYYLVDVIAQILKHLKGELLKSLTMAGHPLKVTDFDWVVTVPAIWKARGKQMMREAGYKVRTSMIIYTSWGAIISKLCEATIFKLMLLYVV